MTRLTKIVRRESCRTCDRGRPIIVTIEPGDLVGFRRKGTRTVYRLTIESVYWLAAKAEAARQAKGTKCR